MASAQDDKFMRAVKVFNVVAGILLIVGTLTLIGALIMRSTDSAEDDAELTTPSVPISAMSQAEDLPQEIGELILPAIENSQVTEIQTANNHALITTQSPAGARQLFWLNFNDGSIREIKVAER